MANCLDYAKIATAVYKSGPDRYPRGHGVDGWTVQKWDTGTFGVLGGGFQGGIWQRGDELVVGFCGTHLTHGYLKGVNDLMADLKILIRTLPGQCRPARHMVRSAKQIANGRKVSVAGHSLGGGLAQVVGLWEQVPFATFNAPAMTHPIKVSHFNILNPFMMRHTWRSKRIKKTPGINFRTVSDPASGGWGDKVSTHGYGGIVGKHVGMVVDLKNETGGGAHSINNLAELVERTDWANIDPFEAL